MNDLVLFQDQQYLELTTRTSRNEPLLFMHRPRPLY